MTKCNFVKILEFEPESPGIKPTAEFNSVQIVFSQVLGVNGGPEDADKTQNSFYHLPRAARGYTSGYRKNNFRNRARPMVEGPIWSRSPYHERQDVVVRGHDAQEVVVRGNDAQEVVVRGTHMEPMMMSAPTRS